MNHTCEHCKHQSVITLEQLRRLLRPEYNCDSDDEKEEYIVKPMCFICGEIVDDENKLHDHVSSCRVKIFESECIFCHKVYAHKNTLAGHLNTCAAKHKQKDIVEFSKEGDVNFYTDHITQEELESALKYNFETCIVKYAFLLFKNQKNQCLKLTNSAGLWTKIHIGNDEWNSEDNIFVYTKFIEQIIKSIEEKYPEFKEIAENPEMRYKNTTSIMLKLKELVIMQSHRIWPCMTNNVYYKVRKHYD